MSEKARKGCEILLHTCGEVKKGERVLVITDNTSREVGEAMYACAADFTDATLVCMPDRSTHGEAPTDAIAAAMKESDVMFSATTFSLYNSAARIAACEAGSRFVNMADYSMEMLEEGCLFTDWDEVRRIVDDLKTRIVGKELSITTPAGTDFRTSIEGRHADTGYGVSRERGEASSPPDAECAVGPADDSAEGTLVIDGSIPLPGLGVLECPITLKVEKGYITSIEGGKEADVLRETLAAFDDKRVYLAAEVGFGLNPAGKLSGRMLEDEGVLGTMHIGIGNNLSYGGSCDTPVHIDLIMKCPTCIVDGTCVMKDGKLVK
ncbi:MAG: aminopeptidase [Lachnospiraceae bacterium]|nr:aminopeptidase [Lachnospiraceae bacterium]MCI9486009.1 aminopeptidase [Lachnospiraceae bacterium]